jgi:hypothetical protein
VAMKRRALADLAIAVADGVLPRYQGGAAKRALRSANGGRIKSLPSRLSRLKTK